RSRGPHCVTTYCDVARCGSRASAGRAAKAKPVASRSEALDIGLLVAPHSLTLGALPGRRDFRSGSPRSSSTFLVAEWPSRRIARPEDCVTTWHSSKLTLTNTQ